MSQSIREVVDAANSLNDIIAKCVQLQNEIAEAIDEDLARPKATLNKKTVEQLKETREKVSATASVLQQRLDAFFDKACVVSKASVEETNV